MYEALRTICACYVRSDREGILDTLHAYRAADALYNIAKAEVALLHPRHSHEACKHADGETRGRRDPTLDVSFWVNLVSTMHHHCGCVLPATELRQGLLLV